MFKKSKGFTLIELLIVVAIIGILAALLIPNAMSALQKAKQKGTMKDIMTIATALTDYVTDNGVAPVTAMGAYSAGTAPYTDLCPFYVKSLPVKDQWGNDFLMYGQIANVSGICGLFPVGDGLGNDDFLILSGGRDGTNEFTYIRATPEAGFYTVKAMSDFNKSLVNWSGSWICGPITRAGGV